MNLDNRTLAHARLALREAARDFLFDPNVHLIDFGYPIQKGQLNESDLAIRFHVREKFSEVALESAIAAGRTRAIPQAIGGFKTDVPQARYRLNYYGSWGNWQPYVEPRAERVEPMRGGISISNEYQYNYGTLGGLVVDRNTGAEMILSNWHVLVGYWGARPGQRVLQAGLGDGGSYKDAVAGLTRDAMFANLDAAVAALNGKRRLLNQQFGLKKTVAGVARAELGMEVIKSGRKTEVTRGRVTAIEGVAKMDYDRLERIIRHVITIEPRRSPLEEVSAGGDSGAWWLEERSMRAVGLHFAGCDRPERALANDMIAVLNALNVAVAI